MRSTSKEISAFSKRLKMAREGLYTQEQLAVKSGVNLRTIQRLEALPIDTTVTPLAQNLLWLSQALDVTPEYLLFGDDNMNIYMEQLKKELMGLSIAEIHYYHKLGLSSKVLSHLKLTDAFIDEIQQYWKENTLSCYRPYVQDTIIRYCHNRPKQP